uniref:Ig-like domain-containing protein n=1 Tax=Colobus angolensis palliatus TaxID=336983 RepID=A0A2K5HY21_COLAP
MSMLVAFLVLWGLPVGLVTEAATFYETQPSLWAESASLLKPSANVMLTCQARLATPDFQLFKNGVAQESVHLDSPAIKHQFLLTGDTRGRYRCRSGLFTRWSQLSKLLELTGPKSLPPPWLSMTPVSWITPGLNTTAVCRGGLLGVTFLLRREGDHEFLEMPEAQEDVEAAFPVHRAGNYSCSYRTHVAGTLSEPSATVIIEQLAAPPPPALMHHGESAQVLRPGDKVTLTCVAPLSGVHFQLRRGEKELLVPGSSTSPDRIFFHLNPVALGDGGHYTCRYRLHDNENAWSGDSTPVELILSDETLPAPEFTAEPAPRPQLRAAWSGAVLAGRDAVLRCEGPIPDVTFELLREGETQAVETVRTPEAAANLELTFVGPQHAGSYRCRYRSWGPNTFQSELSDPVELLVAES